MGACVGACEAKIGNSVGAAVVGEADTLKGCGGESGVSAWALHAQSCFQLPIEISSKG